MIMDSTGGVWHTTSTPQEDTMSIVGKIHHIVHSISRILGYIRFCYRFCYAVLILRRAQRPNERLTTLKHLGGTHFRTVVEVRGKPVVAHAEFMAAAGSSVLAECGNGYTEFPIHTPCLEPRQSD